jgi:hypothetical protein
MPAATDNPKRNTMTDDGGMDISQHRATFDRFWDWAKWGTAVCLVITAIVVVIIA